jgi:hypothetical protein
VPVAPVYCAATPSNEHFHEMPSGVSEIWRELLLFVTFMGIILKADGN